MLSFPDFNEKKIVVINSIEGQKFAIKNENLIVRDPEDLVIFQDSCYKIFSLWIIGNCSITSVLLKKAKKSGFSIFHLQNNFKLIGVWTTATEGNFLLRYKQYKFNDLNVPKHIVQNKILNQLALIKEIRKKEIWHRDALDQINLHLDKVPNATNFNELMGIEGVASKVFFGVYFRELNWKGRKPRAKTDPINVLLDIGYTFVFYWIENMLNLYGFDIYKGIYHQTFYQRKSLVCDLQEPFRSIIDRAIVKMWNLKQINLEHFGESRGKYFIQFEHQKYYTGLFLKAILDYKADLFYYCQGYYRAFIREKAAYEYPFFSINN